MTAERQSPASPEEPLWTLSAVTKATGVGPHTLRAWERRFGFPSPFRRPSGHRRYTNEQVNRLRLIAQAIAMGHRAGTVVPLSTLKLKTLLSGSAARSRGAADPGLQNEIITGALNFDREAVLTCLNKASAELGVKFFLGERIAPLVVEIGCAWAEGRLDIRHEHFLSEILEDTLRGLRAPLEVGARGRPVLLATLPNELHSLGLQMAALTCVMAGRRVRLLGTQTPVEEILAAVDRLDPAAVGLSVTGSSALSETAGTINRLGAHLPESVRLWIGGAGAQELKDLDPSVVALKDLEAMENEIASLPA